MGQVVKLATQQETALGIYSQYFPQNVPSCFQQDLIDNTIKDLGRWRKALEFWAGNDYRAQSIQKMIDYYDTLLATKPAYVGRYDAARVIEPEDPICQTCGKEYCLAIHKD